MSVIYCIENLDNNKKYIGSTIQKVEDRWYDHVYLLKNNSHYNEHLQNAWNKYGADTFKFYVVEDNIEDNILYDREAHWIREYRTLNSKFGYNIREELGGGAFRMSEETKRKIGIANSGENNGMFGKCGEENPMFGKHHTPEVRQQLSELKLGENNPNYGKPMSEEQKRKISEAQSGERNPNYGKPKSEEWKRTVGALLIGNKNAEGHVLTEDQRQKISDTHKGKPKSENHKRRIGDALRGKPKSEQHTQKMRGQNNANATTTELQAIEIIELLKKGVSYSEIAKRCNVSRRVVGSIKRNKTWRHLPR